MKTQNNLRFGTLYNLYALKADTFLSAVCFRAFLSKTKQLFSLCFCCWGGPFNFLGGHAHFHTNCLFLKWMYKQKKSMLFILLKKIVLRVQICKNKYHFFQLFSTLCQKYFLELHNLAQPAPPLNH